MLFDTHAHLDLPPLRDREEEVLRRAREAGVEGVVTVGIDPNGTSVTRRPLSRVNEVFAGRTKSFGCPPSGGF